MHPIVTSKVHASQYAKWGAGCEAFTLLDTDGLSMKQEVMPANTEEQLHYHEQAQQYFFILNGEAVFEVKGVIIQVYKGEGIHIAATTPHRIMNKQSNTLEFLVCSQPSTQNDRFNQV